MNRKRVVRWVLLAVLTMSFSAASFGQIGVGISVRIGPPALPIYAQPICPGPGYLWTPGYWSWDDDDGYYWVPGTWVVAPVGMFWTPGWWGWNEDFYVFHGGYWGPQVGFYGGINYGFGYTGEGFYGGEWRGGDFYYNRSVTNVDVTNITNVYNQTVIVNNTTVNHVSYNGGNGGIAARPTSQQLAAEHDQHQAPLPVQAQHQLAAAKNRELFARVNKGRPPVAATARPADFHSAVPAKAAGAPYHAPAISPREARGPATPGNRPLTPANSNHANRMANRPMNSPTLRDTSKANSRNDGFRPFTQPTRVNSPNHPADFHSAVPAKAAGAPYHAPAISPREARGPATPGNRPLTPANSNHANRMANRPMNSPNLRDTSKANSPRNDSFRPLTQPTRVNSPNHPSNDNRPGSWARPIDSRPSGNRTSDNRPTRNFNPLPSASRPSPSNSAGSPRPQYESHPQSVPRPPQAQHESAPRPAPSHHESTPPQQQRRESAPPPQQRRESPPPPQQRRENAPREPHQPGKGR